MPHYAALHQPNLSAPPDNVVTGKRSPARAVKTTAAVGKIRASSNPKVRDIDRIPRAMIGIIPGTHSRTYIDVESGSRSVCGYARCGVKCIYRIVGDSLNSLGDAIRWQHKINGHILARLIPSAELRMIDDGHLFMVTRPAQTAALIEGFLAGEAKLPT